MKISTNLRLFLTTATIIVAVPGLSIAQEKRIAIDGSSTVYPIITAAAQAYEEHTEGAVEIDVAFSGTTGGFRKFLQGEIDIQDASRPILSAEIAEAKANGIEFIEIPIAYDALTIAVNVENDWMDSIKTSELKMLWEPSAEGTVTRWTQIRPEWPDEEIKLYGAGTDSGTYDYFAEVITGGKTLRKDYTGSEDDNELVAGIERSKYALGFIPFAYYSAEQEKLKAVPIENDYDAIAGESRRSRPVPPSNKAVKEGYYIPLGRPLFIYVNTASLEEKPFVINFLQYFLKDASRFVYDVNYLPLSAISYNQGIEHLTERNTGTRFGGQPTTGIPFYNLLTIDPE